MRPVRQDWWARALACATAALLAAGLAACASAPGGGATAPAPGAAGAEPDYATYSQHFLALQKAGLSGDYEAFAQHLKPVDRQSLIQSLNGSFSGGPFDVYTQRTATSDTAHRRVIELRGTGGRLYLLVHLDRVSGGWKLDRYTIGRNRDEILARL